jgi:hypothetical protein
MAYYAYKTVRDLLPEHIIKAQGPDYEGDGNYDGDQWYAAEAYILELKEQVEKLTTAAQQALEALKFAYNACESEWTMDEKIDPAITALTAALESK